MSEWNCEPLLFDVDRFVGGVEMYLSDWVRGGFFLFFFVREDWVTVCWLRSGF